MHCYSGGCVSRKKRLTNQTGHIVVPLRPHRLRACDLATGIQECECDEPATLQHRCSLSTMDVTFITNLQAE